MIDQVKQLEHQEVYSNVQPNWDIDLSNVAHSGKNSFAQGNNSSIGILPELKLADGKGMEKESKSPQELQMQNTDQQQAQIIMTQIAADAQKQQMERWKVQQELQTKIFSEIQQGTKAK